MQNSNCVHFKKMALSPLIGVATPFRLNEEPIIAVDFGGSLIKVVYLENATEPVDSMFNIGI